MLMCLPMMLSQRGYPLRVNTQARRRADLQLRDGLLKKKLENDTEQFTFTLQYIPLVNKVRRIIEKYWHLVEPFVVSLRSKLGYRKSASFRNKLIRANPFQRIRVDIDLKGHYKCHRYMVCPLTLEGSSFTTVDRSFIVNMRNFFKLQNKRVF